MVRKICGSLAALLFLMALSGVFFLPPSWDDGSREDPFQAGRTLIGTPQATPDPAAQALAVVALIFFITANILLWPQMKPVWILVFGEFVPKKEELARYPYVCRPPDEQSPK